MIDAAARKQLAKEGMVALKLYARPTQWSQWLEKALKAGLPLSDWIAKTLDENHVRRKKS